MTLHFHFCLSFKALNFNDSKQFAGYLSLLLTNRTSVSFIFKKARVWEGWSCASSTVEELTSTDFCLQTKRARLMIMLLLWFWDHSEKSCIVFAYAAISYSFGSGESLARESPANAWQLCLFPSCAMLLGEEAVVKELGRGGGAREDGRGWFL